MKNEKGMGFIEVVVGMLVLSVLSMLLLTLYSTTILWTVRAGDRTTNVSQAAGITENILAGTSVTNAGLNIVLDPGNPNPVTINNASHQVAGTSLTVRFNDSPAHARSINADRVTVTTERDSIEGSTVQTEIVVYKP